MGGEGGDEAATEAGCYTMPTIGRGVIARLAADGDGLPGDAQECRIDEVIYARRPAPRLQRQAVGQAALW